MEKRSSLVRVWILFFNILVPIAYGLLLFFTDSDLIRYRGVKGILGLAVLNAILYFSLKGFAEKKPKEALEFSILGTAVYFFFVLDYFGGFDSFLFPLIYFFIIGAFFYKKLYGFIATGFSASYLIIFTYFFSSDPFRSLAHAFSLILTVAGSYYLNTRAEKLRKSNESLSKLAGKLTSEKSQDEAVLTAIADGVYAVDMNRNMVLINKAAQEMTDWTEKEALGLRCQTVMNLKAGEDVSVCEKDCPALAVWNTGQPVFRTDTCFMNKKNHKRVQLSSSYAPIKDLNGTMVGAICVFRDITKEKELERLRNEFVSTASHELRTPITATEGYLSIATESGMCKVDDKGKEYIDKARGTLLSMSKLIKNLLSVTKIEEGKLEATITAFSIHELIKEVVDVFQKQAQEKGIKLELDESKDLTLGGKKAVGRSLNVRADKEMIREVVNNLTENAIKFTTTGGVTLSIDYDEEFATVNVTDTGMGIPAEGQKHLFEKFYRVDNTATREVGGTGLGLYITRSIVENFGGRIWVDSTQGKGSTFHFTVPLTLD